MIKSKRKELGGLFQNEPPDKAVEPKGKRSDREGKSTTIFQVPEPAKKQLAYLAIDEGTTQQALLIEALNDLFAKYGKAPIA